MEEKKYYVEALDEAIRTFCNEPGVDTLYTVWCTLFEGIEKNYSLPCPVRVEEDKFTPLFMKTGEGSEHFAVLTRLDGEKFVMVADVKLQSIVKLIFKMDECDGIILNPNMDTAFFVSKRFLAYAFSAGDAFLRGCCGEEEQTST